MKKCELFQGHWKAEKESKRSLTYEVALCLADIVRLRSEIAYALFDYNSPTACLQGIIALTLPRCSVNNHWLQSR